MHPVSKILEEISTVFFVPILPELLEAPEGAFREKVTRDFSGSKYHNQILLHFF